jgi:hypothetical protein
VPRDGPAKEDRKVLPQLSSFKFCMPLFFIHELFEFRSLVMWPILHYPTPFGHTQAQGQGD